MGVSKPIFTCVKTKAVYSVQIWLNVVYRKTQIHKIKQNRFFYGMF